MHPHVAIKCCQQWRPGGDKIITSTNHGVWKLPQTSLWLIKFKWFSYTLSPLVAGFMEFSINTSLNMSYIVEVINKAA